MSETALNCKAMAGVVPCSLPQGHFGLHSGCGFTWRDTAQSDQRMEPERYNVIGDELRKLGKQLAEIERKENHLFGKLVGECAQLNEKMDRLIDRQRLMEIAANERYTTVAQVSIRLGVLKDSFEQRLNLLGTDHEQLNVRLDKIECEAQQHYERLFMLISFLQDDISKRFDALNQRIERKVTGKKTRK